MRVPIEATTKWQRDIEKYVAGMDLLGTMAVNVGYFVVELDEMLGPLRWIGRFSSGTIMPHETRRRVKEFIESNMDRWELYKAPQGTVIYKKALMEKVREGGEDEMGRVGYTCISNIAAALKASGKKIPLVSNIVKVHHESWDWEKGAIMNKLIYKKDMIW